MALAERDYRDLLALQFGGQIEVRVPFGRVDVVVDVLGLWVQEANGRRAIPSLLAVEVEPFGSWREGVRQALAYAPQVTRGEGRQKRKARPALAIYGEIPAAAARAIKASLTDLHVELFVLDGLVWTPIGRIHGGREWYRSGPDDAIAAAVVGVPPEPANVVDIQTRDRLA
jgi:hypothetical protein